MSGQLKRIERAEQQVKRQGFFSPDCICFPANEEPVFRRFEDREAAAKVLCPVHGKRFVERMFVFVAKWRWENEVKYRWARLSAQYHRAWAANFPNKSKVQSG